MDLYGDATSANIVRTRLHAILRSADARAREMYHPFLPPRFPYSPRRLKDSLASERYRMNLPGFISVPGTCISFLPASLVILRPDIDGDTDRLMPGSSKKPDLTRFSKS